MLMIDYNKIITRNQEEETFGNTELKTFDDDEDMLCSRK
jgi:hypothetical protein